MDFDLLASSSNDAIKRLNRRLLNVQRYMNAPSRCVICRKLPLANHLCSRFRSENLEDDILLYEVDLSIVNVMIQLRTKWDVVRQLIDDNPALFASCEERKALSMNREFVCNERRVTSDCVEGNLTDTDPDVSADSCLLDAEGDGAECITSNQDRAENVADFGLQIDFDPQCEYHPSALMVPDDCHPSTIGADVEKVESIPGGDEDLYGDIDDEEHQENKVQDSGYRSLRVQLGLAWMILRIVAHRESTASRRCVPGLVLLLGRILCCFHPPWHPPKHGAALDDKF